MLNEDIKAEIRKTFNELKENIPGFKIRPTQNKMIAEVARTLTNQEKNLLVIEAPTGTGKTFAYLVPSIIIAKNLGVKLIISSSNVALQEQIEGKDLIDLIKFSSLDFKFLLIKGRSRYVCLRDLIRLVEDDNQANNIFEPNFFNPISPNESTNLKKLLNDFELRSWNGEIDSLAQPITQELWQRISCNRFTCSGSNCEFYNDCAFFKQRKKIPSADVLITNHDLVLADINSGNNTLPKLDESFIIFDEAHHLADKALSHFNYEISLDNILSLNKQIDTTIKKITNISQIHSDIDTLAVKNIVSDIQNYVKELPFYDEIFLFNKGIIDDDFLIILNNLKTKIKLIYQQFNNVFNDWKDYIKSNAVDRNEQEMVYEAINIVIMQLENIILTTQNLTASDREFPQARWIRVGKLRNNKTNYYLNSAKIDISKELDTLLFSEVKSAVLTSATLSSLGSFDRLKTQLGLKDNTSYFRLPSPFNNKNAKFIVANMQYSPKQVEHTQELADGILLELKKNTYGSLVLFASRYQMNEVVQSISNKVSNLFIQGEMPKETILQKHKQCIDNNSPSVIFGLDSFAEGVDLKGNYLTLVMIAKLRFTVPTSPVEKTMNDYLSSIGKNSFVSLSLPDATLKLIQASGRLLRTEEDKGKIIIFDNRLKTQNWGKSIINSLPDYQIIINPIER